MVETKPLVLVMDDELDICRLMQRILEPAGYEVITASDAARALQLVTQKNPALALLDIKMPGKSGIEVFQELRTSYPDTGVIISTAVSDVNIAINILRDGALDYLVKPFNVSELVISVARALEKRRLVLENRDYQLNLERMVSEQTHLLEQKVRELTALNNLCVTYLNQGFEAAEVYGRLARSTIIFSGEIQRLTKEPQVQKMAGEITKAAEKIQTLAKEYEALKVGVPVVPSEVGR